MGKCGQARIRTQCLPPILCSFPTPGVWGGKGCSPPYIPFPPAGVKTTELFSQLKQQLTDSSCSHWGRHGGPDGPRSLEPAGQVRTGEVRVRALRAPAGHLSPGFPCTQRGDPRSLLCCPLRVHQATDVMQKMRSSPSGEGAPSATSPSHNESPSGYCLPMSTVQGLIPHPRATLATAGQIEVSKLRHVRL